MGVCQCTSKMLLGILGILFAACALFLWAVSGMVIATYHEYDKFVESKFTLVPAACAIAIGIIFFFAAILGFCTLCKENKCILTMFGMFLFILLGLLVAASVLTVMYKDQIKSSVEAETQKTMDQYGQNHTTADKQIDWIQKHLHCCGADNATDWLDTEWGKEKKHHGFVPHSCCVPGGSTNKTDPCKGTDPISMKDEDDYYPKGCYPKVYDIIKGDIKYIGGAVIAFAVLLILGIICTCALCCMKRSEHTPYFSLN